MADIVLGLEFIAATRGEFHLEVGQSQVPWAKYP